MAENLDVQRDVAQSALTDRDISRGVDRTSYTGTDDKSTNKYNTVDNKVDIGEAEAVAAGLASDTNYKEQFSAALLQQIIRQNEAAIRQQEELSVIKQRQLSNAADWDQTVREMVASHNKSRNSQDVKHADVAADRIWNVDEQGYQVAKIVEALGVDNRIAYAAVLDALAKLAREEAAK